MKSSKLMLICLITVLLAGSTVSGQSIAQRLFGKKNPTEDQSQSLELTKKSGPWLIMCASFVGEEGHQQARRLAAELRQSYRFDAYVYSHHFDFEKSAVSNAVTGWVVPTAPGKGNLRGKELTTASQSNFEEFAVLVGDFSSVDSAKAQKALKKIKSIHAESLANFDGQESGEDSPLSGERMRANSDAVVREMGGDSRMQRNKNAESVGSTALRSAFLLTNPLLPDAYFEAQKVDHFVLKLNKEWHIKHSLLDNEGLYTIKIASFFGQTTFRTDEMQQALNKESWLKRNRKGISESALFEAAKKANVLTNYLRKNGIEAYEFHDRHESYVCVGSFDQVVRENGRFTPEVEKMIMKFKGRMANETGQRGALETYRLPDKLAEAGIACDAQPLPVVVPKAPERTASKLFGRFK